MNSRPGDPPCAQADTDLTRLRIAFVVDRFGQRYGGAEAYGVELMRRLSQDHDITVIARQYDEQCDLKLNYLPIKLWSRWPGWIRSYFFARAAARLSADNFDIVHSHMNGWCGHVEVVHVMPVRFAWRVMPISWVKKLSSRTSLRIGMYLWLERARVRQRKAHRVVAVSNLIADQLHQSYDQLFPGAHYTVIPPGVNEPEPTDLHGYRQQVRSRYRYADTDVVCLLVARNPLRKGLRTALQAMASLPSRFKLLVVGAEEGLREQLLPELRRMQLEGRVELHGATSKVAPFYRAADIYIHPTLNDSFGMAPLEAMSYGLPVVISPHPWCGFAQYLQHKQQAMVLSHPQDHQELAGFIQHIADDPSLVQSLRQLSMVLVREQHSWQSLAKQYESLYRQVLNESGH